jgi:hypothetical protein
VLQGDVEKRWQAAVGTFVLRAEENQPGVEACFVARAETHAFSGGLGRDACIP